MTQMNETDREAFDAQWRRMALRFRSDLTEEEIQIRWEDIRGQGLTVELYTAAMGRAGRSARYMPTVADVLTAARLEAGGAGGARSREDQEEAEAKLANCAFHRGEILQRPLDYPIRWCRKCQREQDTKGASGLPLDSPGVPAGARPPAPTHREMVGTCMDRRDEAERVIHAARDAFSRAEAGSPHLAAALASLSTARADLAHWAGMADHYRQRASRDGRDVVPSMTSRQGIAVQPRPAPPVPAPDPRLPREREPGEDDDR